jgi:hypothetical protein
MSETHKKHIITQKIDKTKHTQNIGKVNAEQIRLFAFDTTTRQNFPL